jgi:hypothetical protein
LILTITKAPRERHLETLVHSTLRSIILTRQIPRTLVQVTLQVRSLPEEDSTTGVNTVRPTLPYAPCIQLLTVAVSHSPPTSPPYRPACPPLRFDPPPHDPNFHPHRTTLFPIDKSLPTAPFSHRKRAPPRKTRTSSPRLRLLGRQEDASE